MASSIYSIAYIEGSDPLDRVNNADIAMVSGTGTEGRDGLAGIVGYVDDGTKLRNCVNWGTLTSPLATAKIGGLVIKIAPRMPI